MASVLSWLRSRGRSGGLDPAWVERIRRRYEVRAGYAAYHAFCKSRLARAPASGPSPLVESGRERLRVLDADSARELEREIVERCPARPTVEKSQHLFQFDVADAALERRLLERLVTPEVDRSALRFFESEYFVYWYHVTRSVPVDELGMNSFRWHCDRGPRGHLKLLVYLNGWEEHGGGTELLDLDATRALAASGYVFAPVRTRSSDLSALAARCGTPYAPWSPRLEAGEGILFQPAGVLHRGLASTHGARHVVTLCLLPSPIPWRAAQGRGVRALEGKWHEHAVELRRALAGPAAD